MLNKTNLSTSVVNILEWYDFCLFGYFASVLARVFFPSHSTYLSLVAVFLTFAAGYIMRPIGGLLFGYLADRIGGGRALSYAVFFIALPTCVIGFLPGYHSIGVWSPILLVLIRLLQGLSAGGQYSNSLALLHENNPAKHGAFVVSFAYIGSLAGYLIASVVGVVSLTFFHVSWAWRIPFVLPLMFIPIFLLSSKHLIAAQPRKSKQDRHQVFSLLWQSRRMLFKSIFLACVGGIYYASFFIYLITYLKVYVGMKLANVLLINTICLLSSGVFILWFARLVDCYGRKPFIVGSSIALLILIYPAFLLMHTGDFFPVLLGVWLLTTAETMVSASFAVTYVELFRKDVRYTGCAISYNVGVGVVGGLTPFVLTVVLHHFSQAGLIGFLMAITLLSAVLLWRLIPETKSLANL